LLKTPNDATRNCKTTHRLMTKDVENIHEIEVVGQQFSAAIENLDLQRVDSTDANAVYVSHVLCCAAFCYNKRIMLTTYRDTHLDRKTHTKKNA